MITAENQSVEILKMLLDKGALYITCNIHMMNPLDFALRT